MSEITDQLSELLAIWDDFAAANAQPSEEEERARREKEEEERRKKEEEAKREADRVAAKKKVEEMRRKKLEMQREKLEMELLKEQLEEAKIRRQEAERKTAAELEAKETLRKLQEEIDQMKEELGKRPSGARDFLQQQMEKEEKGREELEKEAEKKREEAEARVEAKRQELKAGEAKVKAAQDKLKAQADKNAAKLKANESVIRAKLVDKEQEIADAEKKLKETQQRIEKEKAELKKQQATGMEAFKKNLKENAVKMIEEENKRKVEEAQAQVDAIRAECDSQMAEMQVELDAALAEAAAARDNDIIQEVARLKGLYEKESKERKKLYNDLVDLKGNIRIYVRVRPAQGFDPGTDATIRTPTDEMLIVNNPDGKPKNFDFDKVFGPKITNAQIFDETIPLLSSAVDGYNVLIFCQGNLRSGKSHTTMGTSDDPGLARRAAAELMKLIKEKEEMGGDKIEVTGSIIEYAGDAFKDLSSGSSAGAVTSSGTLQKLADLSETPVASEDDISALLDKAESAPKAGDGKTCAFIISFIIKATNPAGAATFSKLSFMELPGAPPEKGGDAIPITKMLAALGDVIFKLAKKDKNVNFKASQLTNFFSDSIGGKAKTLMICHLIPTTGVAAETWQTMQYAMKAKGVEMKK
eukprot:TRINITY_DN55075_c0_g1_i1.p1 TRINITY_DN55075_c0_g1~~TRINITY_DN55075_c0_g1_i1.p1  ORF type:complete len:710 (-),score=168.10 TRINITY_DN55075_c0_g1_i1:135-2060(-)